MGIIVQGQAKNRMNLHYIGLFFMLVLAVYGAPKPNPKPDPKEKGQMAIIWNNGRMQRIDLPGTGRGPFDHNGNLYYGNGHDYGNERRLRRLRRQRRLGLGLRRPFG